MTNKLNLRFQLMAASCGLLFDLFYGGSWAVLAHNLPPAAPSLSAIDIAAFYRENHTAILAGNALACLFGAMYLPWTAQLTLTLRRIEGPAPVLTIIQLMGGTITSWAFIFCPAIWATAAYRLDNDPIIVRGLNDVGFFLFNLTYSATSLQAICSGIVGLMDKSETPIFPRWVCVWAIITGLTFVPISLMGFSQTGPFVWNGLVTFWIGFVVFFVWAATMGGAMVKDTRRRMREAGF